jgi:hypothetical protein
MAVGWRWQAAMPCGDAALATLFQDGMDGDQPILLEDADLASGAVHLDRTAACCVGHAIEIAVDRDHAVALAAEEEVFTHVAERASTLPLVLARYGRHASGRKP